MSYLFNDEPRSAKNEGRRADADDTAEQDAFLLEAVARLPAHRLDRFCDALAGRPELAAIRWQLRERPSRPERFPERNARILSLRILGRTLGEISFDLGVSRQVVRGVVRRWRQRRISVAVESTAAPPRDYDEVD